MWRKFGEYCYINDEKNQIVYIKSIFRKDGYKSEMVFEDRSSIWRTRIHKREIKGDSYSYRVLEDFIKGGFQ